MRAIVDNVMQVAEIHGAAEVYVRGNMLRIDKPCANSKVDYDNWCCEYKHGLTRAEITEKLLSAFILAVTDR